MSKPTHVPPHPGQQKRRQPIQDDIMAGADAQGGEATTAPSDSGAEPELEDIVEEVTEAAESAAPSEPVSQDFRDQRIQMR